MAFSFVRPSAGPCRLEFRAGPTVSRLLRLTPRGARSAVGGIRLCVSGIVKAQRQPLSDTTYIARGWVPNLDLNEASVKLVGWVPEKGVRSL